MHPLFIAHGPAFRSGFKVEPFRNVDIYPLMCRILGVEPAAHNGTIANVIDMLVDRGLFFKLNTSKNHFEILFDTKTKTKNKNDNF